METLAGAPKLPRLGDEEYVEAIEGGVRDGGAVLLGEGPRGLLALVFGALNEAYAGVVAALVVGLAARAT